MMIRNAKRDIVVTQQIKNVVVIPSWMPEFERVAMFAM